MDRSHEFLQICEIYRSHELPCIEDHRSNRKEHPTISLSNSIFEGLQSNEDILSQIERSTSIKDLSSDFVRNVADLSKLFENRVTAIQTNLAKLRHLVDHCSANTQSTQHFRLVQQFLSKGISNQVAMFKKMLKQHELYLTERSKRLEKYGKTSSISSSSSVNVRAPQVTASYAMFHSQPPASLTQRKVSLKADSGTKQAYSNEQGYEEVSNSAPLYEKVRNDDSRLRHAEKAEATIKQMGHLFTQVASLIAEQSEVILRIEDDVETGLSNTLEGHKHLQDVYQLTKGNRSIIIKVFLLLLFFTFLFLVWT